MNEMNNGFGRKVFKIGFNVGNKKNFEIVITNKNVNV